MDWWWASVLDGDEARFEPASPQDASARTPTIRAATRVPVRLALTAEVYFVRLSRKAVIASRASSLPNSRAD